MATARKCLIVEDDPWVARLLEYSARDRGWVPLVVANGVRALEVVFEELPDAVLTDAVVPQLDGIELSRRIKSSRVGVFTPVMIFSGVLQEERELLTRSRADAFFPKPVSPDLVAAAIDVFFPPELEVPANSSGLPPGVPGEISLGAQPLPLALARLHHQRQTGLLHIRIPGGSAELVLRDGQIVQTRATGWTETFLDALVRLGKVTPTDATRLSDSHVEPWFEQKARIVAEGLTTEDEATEIWTAVQSARVIEAFRWAEGYHRFEPGPMPVSASDVQLDTPPLIHWGLHRATLPSNALEQAVPSLKGSVHRHEKADEILRLLPLSKTGKWLLDQANGPTSLEALGLQVATDTRATDDLVRSAIVLHALGALTIEIPRLLPVQDEIEPAELIAEQDLSGGPAKILLSLWHTRATGIFTADEGPARHLLYLRDGQLVASRSNEIERLDSLLAQRGRIRPDVLPRVRQLVDNGRNVGDALVEEKAITASQLQTFVRGELANCLAALLRARELEVSFTTLPLPANELALHEWDTASAVVEMARAQDVADFQELMPAPDLAVHRLDTLGVVAALPLSPSERGLWNVLSVPQRVEDLVDRSPAPEDGRRALAVLMTLGMVQQATVEERPRVRRRKRDALALPEESEDKGTTDEMVPRALYLALQEEKQALEDRLKRYSEGFIEREPYELLLREKIELKARVSALLAELRRAREVIGDLTTLDESVLDHDLDPTEEPRRQVVLVGVGDD